jgi:hypothetical protein
MVYARLIVTNILAILGLTLATSCAHDAEHHDADPPAHHHDHEHHPDESAGSATPAAHDYADAVKQIQAHMVSLDAIIKSGEYDSVHKDCVAIGKLCDSLRALAAAEGSRVPKDKLDEVAESAKQLSAASRDLHHAAHSDDVAKLKLNYEQMTRLVASLSNYR